MRARRVLTILLPLSALGLAGCSSYYDDYGYGYGGVSIGYGRPYYGSYYGNYYNPYYGGSYYGNPYWGWYNDFYYPGVGIYVYDRYRRPYRWNDYQRNYWEGRRRTWRGGANAEIRENWRDFAIERRQDERAFRGDRRELRRDYRQGELTRDQFRQQRRELRRDYRQDRRQDRRELRRENRRDRRD